MALTLKQDFTQSTLAGAAVAGPELTFSRGSGAMKFDSTGTLVFAPSNLNVYSEQFDNAAWTKAATTITANAATAPDGETTADEWIGDGTSTGVGYTISDTLTSAVVNGDLYTWSVYVKNVDQTDILLHLSTGFGSNTAINVDTTDGTVTTVLGSIHSSGSESVGNGWYRVWYSLNATATGNAGLTLYFSEDGTWAGRVIDPALSTSVYIWGSQFEKSTGSPTTYVPTTSAAVYSPRLASHTYNGTSWVNRGVLIEEARTNSVLQSEDFSTSWTSDGVTETTNDATAPDGNTTADKLVENTGTADHRVYQGVGGYTANEDTTFSVFAKYVDTQYLAVSVNNGDGNVGYVIADVQNGSISDSGAEGDVTLVDSGIEDVSGGWYRVWVSVSRSTGTSLFYIINLSPVSTVTTTFAADMHYTGDGSSGVHVWGAQVEKDDNSFPTSYIPTTTASVTRSADDLDTTTLSWLDTAATAVGTFVVEAQFPWAAAAAYPLIQLDDNVDTNDRIYIERDASENINFKTVHASDTDGDCSPTDVISEATQFEVAAAYADDDIATSTDGATVTTDATAALPLGTNPVAFHVGNDLTNYWNGYIKHLRYYDERLANDILENPPPFDARPMLMLMGVGR